MKITSSAFEHNKAIPSLYTYDEKNVNPPLAFSEIPNKAKSLALIVVDPDAPNGDWVHWVLFNIDPTTVSIEENSVPENAIEAVTSFGTNGYGGPCPPSGTHRYFFKLYALDSLLNLNKNATKKEVKTAMQSHILETAELIGLYKRN